MREAYWDGCQTCWPLQGGADTVVRRSHARLGYELLRSHGLPASYREIEAGDHVLGNVPFDAADARFRYCLSPDDPLSTPTTCGTETLVAPPGSQIRSTRAATSFHLSGKARRSASRPSRAHGPLTRLLTEGRCPSLGLSGTEYTTSAARGGQRIARHRCLGSSPLAHA